MYIYDISRLRVNMEHIGTNKVKSQFFLYFYLGQCEEVREGERMSSYRLFLSIVLLWTESLNFGSFVFQPAGIFTHRQLL